MPELIDKAKLIEYLAAIKPDEYVSAYGEAAVDVINHVEEYVNAMPTIEAEPVRYGKLLEGKTFNDQHCSVCGQRFRDDISFILPSDENGFPMPKRCPECGCYWDGGADNA